MGCSSHSGPEPEDLAAHMAKAYYDSLLQGRYDAFVDGTLQPSAIPEGYRRQLTDNAKMFIAQQQDEHGGIDSVSIASARADTAQHTASVFLQLHFGDKTTEEVLVPMVQHDGAWYMR